MLPTRPLADFLPLVLPHAPSCPRPVAEQYIRLAAIEWCERTRCWREIMTTAITAQGDAIVAPDYATIHEIETAQFSSDSTAPVDLSPIQFSHVKLDEWSEPASGSAPRYITQTAPNKVSVLPFQAGNLELSLFLKPRSGTEYGSNPADPLQDKYNVIPEHVFIQSAEPVVQGALGRLLAIRESDWFDPKEAVKNLQLFEIACDKAFQAQITGQHRAVPRVRSHFI